MVFQMNVNNSFVKRRIVTYFYKGTVRRWCEWGVQAAFALQRHNRAGDYFLNAKYTAPKTQAKLNK